MRQPWCLLSALGVDLRDAAFMGWARGQILRLSSAIFRRYECKLACYPFCLFPLVDPTASDDKKNEVATALLRAPRHKLDTYSYGIRRMFRSVQLLTSFKCTSILAADFASHTYGSDHIERLNAQLTRLTHGQGPGRSMTRTSRASLLQQSHAVHVERGGRPALEVPRKGNITHEDIVCLPLLMPNYRPTDLPEPFDISPRTRSRAATRLSGRCGTPWNTRSTMRSTRIGGKVGAVP